jgi:hypothetical protein
MTEGFMGDLAELSTGRTHGVLVRLNSEERAALETLQQHEALNAAQLIRRMIVKQARRIQAVSAPGGSGQHDR